ncbi:MAG: hypothetical protein OXE82_07620 [Rhodobacter sp.]|nr:hypothetical protein [Rhodobacter sp.]
MRDDVMCAVGAMSDSDLRTIAAELVKTVPGRTEALAGEFSG